MNDKQKQNEKNIMEKVRKYENEKTTYDHSDSRNGACDDFHARRLR
jgi:hypothetical protein